MRVVLDSSVLVSAFLTPHGSVIRVLHDPIRSRYELWLSEYILIETAGTLIRKSKLRQNFSYTDTDVRDYIRWLLAEARIVNDLPQVNISVDPKDNPIIATAIAANAEYLITGDRAHLLPIENYQGVRIMSPNDFLTSLNI